MQTISSNNFSYEWEGFSGKRFRNNWSLSAKYSMQEGNKSSKCHFYYTIPKMLLIKSSNIITNQNYPTTYFFQPKSRPVQTHLFNLFKLPSLQQHQLAFPWQNNFPDDFCNTCNFCCPKTNVSIRINILTKQSKNNQNLKREQSYNHLINQWSQGQKNKWYSFQYLS